MLRVNQALISEVKRRLPKNVNPPVTLELLLRQKAVEKIENKIDNDSRLDENLMNKKAMENFIKNNLSKPFSALKRKLNMRQSIITQKKRCNNLSNINKKFNTPFQIQHIKMDYQRFLINKKIHKKFPNFEINKDYKNVFGIFKRNQSCSCFNINRSNMSSDGKNTYRLSFNNNTKHFRNNSILLNKTKNYSYSFCLENNLKHINEDLNKNYGSSRNRKKIKPNCYYNKLHLQKLNKSKRRQFSPTYDLI